MPGVFFIFAGPISEQLIEMQTAPRIRLTVIIICTCIIAFSSAFAMTALFNSDEPKPVAIEEKMTFKKMIALKTLEEYDRWHSNGLTIREKDTAVRSILKAYWKLGGIDVKDYQLENGSWQYNHPWSAVFISWVMKQAGAGDKFPYSILHSKYIVWARDNVKKEQLPLYAAYDITDSLSAWPEPGDLICMNRKRNRFNMNTIDPSCISHCDIVVEVNKEQGYIISIGGNVGQTVNKRMIWLDQSGFVDTTRNYKVLDAEEKDPEGSQKEIFGIIRVNRQY